MKKIIFWAVGTPLAVLIGYYVAVSIMFCALGGFTAIKVRPIAEGIVLQNLRLPGNAKFGYEKESDQALAGVECINGDHAVIKGWFDIPTHSNLLERTRFEITLEKNSFDVWVSKNGPQFTEW